MGYHLHRQIREAMETALTGLATSGSRVYANRLAPLDAANLPGLRLYADSESAEAITIHGPTVYERTLAMVVECCAKAASGLDDTLDGMSKEVEAALASGLTVAGRVLEVRYTGMEFADEQADKPVGVKRLTFSISYTATASAPDTLA